VARCYLLAVRSCGMLSRHGGAHKQVRESLIGPHVVWRRADAGGGRAVAGCGGRGVAVATITICDWSDWL
jgi:hypothetical protein